jgi:hypothetical protein
MHDELMKLLLLNISHAYPAGKPIFIQILTQHPAIDACASSSTPLAPQTSIQWCRDATHHGAAMVLHHLLSRFPVSHMMGSKPARRFATVMALAAPAAPPLSRMAPSTGFGGFAPPPGVAATKLEVEQHDDAELGGHPAKAMKPSPHPPPTGYSPARTAATHNQQTAGQHDQKCPSKWEKVTKAQNDVSRNGTTSLSLAVARPETRIGLTMTPSSLVQHHLLSHRLHLAHGRTQVSPAQPHVDKPARRFHSAACGGHR